MVLTLRKLNFNKSYKQHNSNSYLAYKLIWIFLSDEYI